MASFISQSPATVTRGNQGILATVVRLDGPAETVELPNMAATSNSAVQLRRPGDGAVTVTQTDINTISITGGSAGQEVLIISSHGDPILGGPTPGTAF